MALSTRAALAAVGGALAIGALGITGVAYAGGDEAGTPQYVTTVQDDGTATAPAPGTDGRDCPEKDGAGSGSSGSEGSGSPESTAPGSSAPDSSTADDA